MAIRYAVANGNWSDPATWDGGTLPAAADDVYANGKSVNIDQSITVNSLSRASNTTPAIASGGSYTVTAAAVVTITGGILAAHVGASGFTLITVNAGSAEVAIQTPSIAGGASSANSHAITIAATHLGPVAVRGLSGARTAISVSQNSSYGINNLASTTITITGNVTGGVNSDCHAVYNAAASATIILNGNSTGGVSGHGIYNSGNSCTITITGNVTAGSSNGYGLYNIAASLLLTITGDVAGGSGNGGYGVSSSGASAVINITGNVTGGGISSYGINASSGAITIRGNIFPGSSAAGTAAIRTSGEVAVRISGNIYSGRIGGSLGPSGYMPLACSWCAIAGEPLTMWIYDDSSFPTGNAGTVRKLEISGGAHPDAANVRKGIKYGLDDSIEGTLAVPPAATVLKDVPVDDTVGTLPLASLADVAGITGAQIVAATGA